MNPEDVITLDVTGMTCGACVRHVQRALDAVPGVTQVEVRLLEHEATIRHDGRAGTVDALLGAVAKSGYGASVR